MQVMPLVLDPTFGHGAAGQHKVELLTYDREYNSARSAAWCQDERIGCRDVFISIGRYGDDSVRYTNGCHGTVSTCVGCRDTTGPGVTQSDVAEGLPAVLYTQFKRGSLAGHFGVT